MSKTVVIKLKKASERSAPFRIKDGKGNVLSENVSFNQLISGVSYYVDDDVTVITIESLGKGGHVLNIGISTATPSQQAAIGFTYSQTACLWRHLTDVVNYNHFYGVTEPYIIEYPFAYKYHDEILQSVQDYTKAFQYFTSNRGVFDDANRIEVDDIWFNKAVLYNGQQSSGILELAPKPVNNLKEYMKYPVYKSDSKVITFTKSDNFYQYNTFWSLVRDRKQPLFITSCSSLSVDKEVNQSNMDYNKRSFKKEPLRAKDLKVRHILDSRSDIHLVSQFILTSTQISYK
jgi:hypothetical protein